MPDDIPLRLSWALSEAVDAELGLRTVVVRLRTALSEAEADQPLSTPLGELAHHFAEIRDRLTAILDVLADR